jgi:hypothetical protein
VLRLLVTANVVPSSLILFTLMMEVIRSSEIPYLTPSQNSSITQTAHSLSLPPPSPSPSRGPRPEEQETHLFGCCQRHFAYDLLAQTAIPALQTLGHPTSSLPAPPCPSGLNTPALITYLR